MLLQAKKAAQSQPKSEGAAGGSHAPNPTPNPTSGGARSKGAAEKRMENDLSELDNFGEVITLVGADKSLLRFEIHVVPARGLWASCKYIFALEIPDDYPYSEPKIKCKTKIYHPNIDLDGNVCLGELVKTKWTPTTTFNQYLVQLGIVLFDNPEPSDPLNLEAAASMRDNYAKFCQDVERTLRGGQYFGHQFERLKK